MVRTRCHAVLWPEEGPEAAPRPPAQQPSDRFPLRQLRRVAGQQAVSEICRIALTLALVGALGGGLACQRKAPGPDECLAFAKIWLQQRKFESVLAQAPDRAFDELVLSCLTEPYDRTLVECVISRQRPERCRGHQCRR